MKINSCTYVPSIIKDPVNNNSSFNFFQQLEDLPPLPPPNILERKPNIIIFESGDDKRMESETFSASLNIQVQLPGCLEFRNIFVASADFYFTTEKWEDGENCLSEINQKLKLLSVFIPINKECVFWMIDESYHDISFSLTEELAVDYSIQYAILTGIPFQDSSMHTISYPVVKATDVGHYKAIGILEITGPSGNFFSGYGNGKVKTFIIQ
ncbi:hypothetical protein BDA99DRAFT_522541 [Phascolomyces articulosus]|uniref:Uncharacterized protein n=1 Tax=Phascolomyces articulosus TaxID=60185 RepID=A0AAD5P9L4_9FUNG|nr:hypothetical protein BDA99DRAFT_522541 [Phascolomyces articulosus]